MALPLVVRLPLAGISFLIFVVVMLEYLAKWPVDLGTYGWLAGAAILDLIAIFSG